MRCSCISAATATAHSQRPRLGDGETELPESSGGTARTHASVPWITVNNTCLGLTTVRVLVNRDRDGDDTINQTMGVTAAG